MVRRPAAVVLVAFALLAALTPEAVAQAPPRQGLRELWRQFPLETRPSLAERESTREVSAPTNGGTPGERTDGSVTTAQTASIVLALALVLMLTTGALAYAARGQFEFVAFPRKRRLAQSFPGFLAAPPVEAPPHAKTERPERREPNGKRRVRGPGRPQRRAKRAAAVSAMASIISEVDALSARLDVDAATKAERRWQDRIERLSERLNMYFASAKGARTANDEVRSLKAKLDVQRAPVKSESIPHDEREKLREKLGLQPAYTESASQDERRTLKEKLGKPAAASKGVTTTHEERETIKAKLAKHAALPTAERDTADEAALKRELRGAGAAAKREMTVRPPFETQAVAVDALDTTLREPRVERAAAAAPATPRPVSAATRRSTISELVSEHGSDLALIGLVLINVALLLLIIAAFLGIGVEPY
jgi:hypothetical protein